MADARRRSRHVHETRVLSYGHLGTASYDDRNHEWTFLRQHQTQQVDDLQNARVTPTGSSHFLVADERMWNSAPNPVHSTWPAQDATPGRGLQNFFLKRVPDAAFVAVDLPGSENTVASRSKHRPSEDVLAFGHARRPFDSGSHNNTPYTPVVAMRSSSSTETLQLFIIDTQQVEIPNEAGLSDLCMVPFIANQASGTWTDSTDEIIQVASCSQSKGTQFLVVKPSGTTVLRPVLSKPKASEGLLDPCPIVTIPRSRTGGQPHVYAAFNPQDQSLVALADASGQWSIWKLTGKYSRSARILQQVSLKASNDIGSIERQSRSSKGFKSRNTWHRVCWLTSPEGIMDRLLVCNRHFAAAFDQTGLFLGEVDMRLGSQPDRNVILDVKNSGRRSDRIFVLTSSRLLIFCSPRSGGNDRHSGEALELECSWNHYRDRTDLGLGMSVLESSEDSWVLLYSTTSHLAIIYRFGQEDVHSTTISIQDPSTFQLPYQLKGHMKDVSEITMRPAAFSIQPQPTHVVRFGLIKLVAYLATGEIIEALYKHELGQFGFSNHLPETVLHLSMPRPLKTHPISAKYIRDEDLDDFAVRDGEGADDFAGKAGFAQTTAANMQRVSPSSRNWQRLLLYEALKDNDNSRMSFESALQPVMEHHFERLKGENNLTPMHLMSDLTGRCRITDVEHDSQIADQWLDTLALQDSITVVPAAIVVGGVSSSSHRQLLLDLYESLVRAYVEPLSDQITDRGRVNRERLVRQIVGDGFFGAFALTSKIAPPPSASPRPYWTPTRDREAAFPPIGLELDDPESSQAPTPEALPDTEEPTFSHLRRYVTFRHEVPPLLLEHRPNISNILAHLPNSIEQNPADYSYQQTNQKMKLAQEEMAAESLNPQERKKALRSAARLQRKLERTQIISQEVMMRRNILPGISSGPKISDLPVREVQSSQPIAPSSSQRAGQGQGGLPEFSMTQPERGAYGTRQAEKKGKKGTKRRAGF
ncbi:uncharacterized protein Z520_08942 [Fonsecaea multimorphosa CBS 102226]|uniref:RNA polymerase I-specific transcription initiation factor RRN6-like protein n=1 Tax=Fonsecaea multimorphosa CBS 102226 TaxID=1442371 RepID=A0A0D2H0W2_9EURO|nr:uncharacterized protein Z520_08942 [Fonsecaea multimorphosa CBS 102226]KIX95425.1 hypothetical protein Z520_08942 [Fonsecaea multimorphosa CBS 102226]OAL20957.1 hypothetical protein AYO22_08377 [Fonsecaea multimorphosa]